MNDAFRPDALSRRLFLKRTSAAVAGGALLGALSPERFALGASGSDTLKVALIGCGGRGSGAANQALNTQSIGPVKLVAMADIFPDRLNTAHKNLQGQHSTNVEVPEDQ